MSVGGGGHAGEMLGRQRRGLGVAVTEHGGSGPGSASVIKTAGPPALALARVVGGVLERRRVARVTGQRPRVVPVEAREPLAIW